MIFKSLKAVLISLPFLFAAAVACADVIPDKSRPLDVMPESPRAKADRIENVMNDLFERGLKMSATELGQNNKVRPFAIIKRKDGKIGVFGADNTEKNAKQEVEVLAASIRRHLIELVLADQIEAAIQVMFATIRQENKEPRQGLVFELEHEEGVSLLRFLPVSKVKDKQGNNTEKLLFELETLSTTVKPSVIFAYAKVK
jgi:hypothetical protein